MTQPDPTIAEIARGLSAIQREAIRRSRRWKSGWGLTDWQEDSWDITEGLSEKLADPVCGKLTRLGNQVRQFLKSGQSGGGV